MKFSDSDLLTLLFENAKTSYVELARQLKVTETAVRKRVHKLVRKGIIKRYTIEVDREKLGYELAAFIGLDTEPEKYFSVQKKLRNKRSLEVKQLFTTSGDHMLMIEGWFRDNQHLTAFIEDLETWPGVTKVCPAIIHQQII
ncbi:MAG: Lrp/AsnC family transcriptional regulator [Candidatus Hodarchaeales archaeon]